MKSHYEYIFFIIHSIVDEHVLVSFLAVVNRMAISMDIQVSVVGYGVLKHMSTKDIVV